MPATMHQALDLLMAGLTWEEVLIYLNDLIIFAPTFDVFLEEGPHQSEGKSDNFEIIISDGKLRF